jgi:hypothetical protein
MLVSRMNEVIQVTLKENEDMVTDPKQYNYVVDVSRQAIMDDLKSEQSLLRSWLQDTPNLEEFIDQNFKEVQQIVGQRVASTYTRRNKQPRSGLFSADVEFRVAQAPNRKYDGAIGAFGFWKVP